MHSIVHSMETEDMQTDVVGIKSVLIMLKRNFNIMTCHLNIM